MTADSPSPDAPDRPPRAGAASAAAAVRGGAWLCDVPEWGVIDVFGADAATFLQGQLSSDVKALSAGAGRWTSYNSPKGRMLANGFLWRPASREGYRLALAADLALPVRKRLSMFVLRAKVTLTDASAATALLGVTGPAAAGAVTAALGACPSAGQATDLDGVDIVALPDGRVLILAVCDEAPRVRRRLLSGAAPADPLGWQRAGIQAGVPWITLATQDLFVPQAANWDLLGGVDFRKGCYTGQEIVARTQYLGRLKERCRRFCVAEGPPAPGSRLYGSTFGDQPCGTVVNAVAVSHGGSELLAVVQSAAAETGDLRLGTPDGPALRELALPYTMATVVTPPARAR